MSTHTIEAEIKVKFRFAGLAEGEQETAYPSFVITYQYSPGSPAFTPRGEYAPIDPPEPAEVEFISAHLVNNDGLEPSAEQVNDWAQEWLASDEGYSFACNHAEEARRPDPDEAYERTRDDRDFFGADQ